MYYVSIFIVEFFLIIWTEYIQIYRFCSSIVFVFNKLIGRSPDDLTSKVIKNRLKYDQRIPSYKTPL